MIQPIDPVAFFIPDGAGGTDTLVVDACVKEDHALENATTDHPVEEGYNVTDHSRPQPRRLSLECVVSNSPIGRSTLSSNDALATWRIFEGLWKNPQRVSVSTSRGLYESMLVEKVTNAVDAKSANALVFTVTLKEIRVVKSRYSRIVVAKDTRAQPKQKAGQQSTQAPPEKEVESVANKLKNSGVGQKLISTVQGALGNGG